MAQVSSSVQAGGTGLIHPPGRARSAPLAAAFLEKIRYTLSYSSCFDGWCFDLI